MKTYVPVIAFLLLLVVYQAVIINDQKNDISIKQWALDESGHNFAIQRAMLQRCEKIVLGQ